MGEGKSHQEKCLAAAWSIVRSPLSRRASSLESLHVERQSAIAGSRQRFDWLGLTPVAFATRSTASRKSPQRKTGWLVLRVLAIKPFSTLSTFRLALPFHNSVTLATRRAFEALDELPVSRGIQLPLFAPAVHIGYLREIKNGGGGKLFGFQGDRGREPPRDSPPSHAYLRTWVNRSFGGKPWPCNPGNAWICNRVFT